MQKNWFVSPATALLIFLGLQCQTLLATELSAQEQSQIKTTIEARFPKFKIDSVGPSPIEGLYEIVIDGQVAYVNKDASRLFSGEIVDTETKKNLTTLRWNELHSLNFKSLPFEQAIKIVKGNGQRKLAIFADPLCPFCAKLEQELQAVNDATFYVFLFPLEELHPGATQMAEKIWCATDRSIAWESWMLERKPVGSEVCKSDTLEQIHALGAKLKINSTPTLFFENGYRISGAMTAANIEAALKKSL